MTSWGTVSPPQHGPGFMRSHAAVALSSEGEHARESSTAVWAEALDPSPPLVGREARAGATSLSACRAAAELGVEPRTARRCGATPRPPCASPRPAGRGTPPLIRRDAAGGVGRVDPPRRGYNRGGPPPARHCDGHSTRTWRETVIGTLALFLGAGLVTGVGPGVTPLLGCRARPPREARG